jgi:hypothetical protein
MLIIKENLKYILKEVNFENICRDLRKKIEGNEKENKLI